MRSKRIYKDAPGDNVQLPREVYYRCLWIVRDEKRLEQIASMTYDASKDRNSGRKHRDTSADHVVSEETVKQAAFELSCIGRALLKVPEGYRNDLLGNIIDKEPFPDFAHPNTWKRWKLVFLHELARELHLI